MSGAARNNTGSKMVVVAVSAMLAALGVGTIYLPFVADKDRLRGLHEEGDVAMSGRDKREYDRMLKEMGEAGQLKQDGMRQEQQQQKKAKQQQQPFSNSMWKRINDAASGAGK